MEQSEVEKLIGELEIAIDRLRSLYEQYFVGIEKLEPQVPRKDVDRKIHSLRREQIRNTALRFRFQMVLQKYNTYQTHWQRVCREIENGTYKRHMMRAQRRFASTRPPRGRSSAPPPPLLTPEPGAPLAPDLQAQLAEFDRDFAPSLPGPGPQAGPPRTDLPPRPPQPSRPGPVIPPPFKASRPPLAPSAPGPAGASLRPGVPGAPSIQPQRSGVPGAPTAPPAAVWKKVGALPSASMAPAARAPTVTPAAVPTAARIPAAMAPVPAAAAPTAAAVPVAGAIPAAPAMRPPAASAPAHPPPPPPAPAPAAPRAAPNAAHLSEERLRQLYSELVETKRRQNESTAAITYQSVAKSLMESSDRLHKQHGRAVDFEVMVKDGKAVLRPVIK